MKCIIVVLAVSTQPLKTKLTWEISIFIGNVHVQNMKVASDLVTPANNYCSEKSTKEKARKFPVKMMTPKKV